MRQRNMSTFVLLDAALSRRVALIVRCCVHGVRKFLTRMFEVPGERELDADYTDRLPSIAWSIPDLVLLSKNSTLKAFD